MSTFEKSSVAFLSAITTPATRTFYQHLAADPGAQFIWFVRNGDEELGTIDGDGGPDIIYLDVECYASDLGALTTMVDALRAKHDHRGAYGTGTVEDVAVSDQQDSYVPQATGDTLPPYSTALRLRITLYEE